MENFEVRADCTCSDEAIDRRSKREAAAACGSIEADCIFVEGGPQRGFDDRESKHCFMGDPVSMFIAKTL